jgi:hypothetical protein
MSILEGIGKPRALASGLDFRMENRAQSVKFKSGPAELHT